MADLMMCGNCGKTRFLVSYEGEDSHHPTGLVITCVACKSSTVVSMYSSLKLSWGEGAEGVLCPIATYGTLKEEAEEIERERE